MFIRISNMTASDLGVRNFSRVGIETESVSALHLPCLCVGRHSDYFSLVLL